MDRVRSGYINYGRNFDALCPIPNTKARQKKLSLRTYQIRNYKITLRPENAQMHKNCNLNASLVWEQPRFQATSFVKLIRFLYNSLRLILDSNQFLGNVWLFGNHVSAERRQCSMSHLRSCTEIPHTALNGFAHEKWKI